MTLGITLGLLSSIPSFAVSSAQPLGFSPSHALGGYQYRDSGYIYSNVTIPQDAAKKTDFNRNTAKLKQGTSSKINILRLIEVGDAGINKAAGSAGITKINYIDVNETSLLILFKTITTTVYGE
ncbi:MAG: TRL domain-containing protein [Vampirovibrionales bacterium]|nr:TRL domain-containing protein [Vampirovibrionales bacterium]